MDSATSAAEGKIKDPAELKAEMAATKEVASGGDATGTHQNGAATESNGKSDPEPQKEPVAGPSSGVSPSKKDLDVVSKAMQHFAAGKRDLFIQDPANAVASLAQACELLGEHYGETAPECGVPYYYYGKALLDLARMEAGVIDNVLDGVPSDEDKSAENSLVEDPEKCTDEEKDKVADQVSEALSENFEALEKLKKEKVDKDAKEKEVAEKKGTDADAKINGCSPKVNGGSPKDDKDVAKVNGGSPKDDKDVAKVNGGSPKIDKEMAKVDDGSLKVNAEVKGDCDVKDESPDANGQSKSPEKTAIKESENSADDDEEEEEEANGEGEEAPEDGEGSAEEEAETEEEKKDESITGDDKQTTEEKDTGDAAAVEKEEEEDPSNLQLSWEMLELAKNILTKQSETLDPVKDKERKFEVESKISDTFQTLGELSIENENYPQALIDLNTCLEWRQKLMPEDSRLIAETHYQIGVAKGFNIDFDSAVESLDNAIGVLQKRIDLLKEEKESVDPSKKNDAFYTREGEIKEIESLLPEIREKIADTKDMKEETKKKLGDKRFLEEEISSKQGESSGASAISSSLIKKRKKSIDDTSSVDPKKPHIDEQPSSSNGTKNGH